MSPEKTTIMVLKVDLDCSSCYKKVKKVLCKFPQIRDQVFDEKTNTVIITVVCCSPEKIRDKLYCKGGKAIKCIEIKEPPTPKDPEKSTKPEEQETSKVVPEKQETSKGPGKPKSNCKCGDKSVEKPPPPKADPPTDCTPTPCCGQCYHGYGGGPCHQGFGRRDPPPPGPCYNGYWYWGNRACYVTRCDYFNEENPSSCSFM